MYSTMKKTVALVRVSTADQTVEPQTLAIEKWAEAQGASIGKWYGDVALSGASTKRPDLDALLRDVRRGRVGRVVVAELSRVSRRGLAHIAAVLDELTASGCVLVSLREGIDSGTPMGRAMMQMASIFAELEREHLRDRTRAGLKAARKRGKTLGRPRLIWTDQELEELRELRAEHSLTEIAAGGTFKVFDSQGMPRVPSERSMRRALAQHADAAA